MDKKLGAVFRQSVEEVELFGDLGQHLGALLQKCGDSACVNIGIFHRRTNVRLRNCGKLLGAHAADVLGVKITQLFYVENCGGLAQSVDIEYLRHLRHGVYLTLAAGTPAQKRNVIHDCGGDVALRNEVLV